MGVILLLRSVLLLSSVVFHLAATLVVHLQQAISTEGGVELTKWDAIVIKDHYYNIKKIALGLAGTPMSVKVRMEVGHI